MSEKLYTVVVTVYDGPNALGEGRGEVLTLNLTEISNAAAIAGYQVRFFDSPRPSTPPQEK